MSKPTKPGITLDDVQQQTHTLLIERYLRWLKKGIPVYDREGNITHYREPNAAEMKRIAEALEAAGYFTRRISATDELNKAAMDRARAGTLKFKGRFTTDPAGEQETA